MEILRSISNNAELLKALREKFHEAFNKDEVNLQNVSMTDELIGQITRARLDGLRKVDEVLRQIESMKPPEETELPPNPAR